ncbi:MAG: hypothetical protein ACI8QI_001392 [Limisphaerales bacterium]|jgi:hypothetical protein
MNRIATLWLIAFSSVVNGQNSAPSSHFVFDDNFDGDIVINEVRVPKLGEAMYTYYEGLGWRGGAAGYAGIQVHPRGHNYIFSIWDHKDHTAPIRAVHRGAGTLTEKFGGEGTGLKSWNFELGWETDTWHTLVSRAWPIGDHTFYGYWVRSGKTKTWTHLVTMDVAAKEAFFKGSTDAFIEDWLNTGSKPRTTNLRGGWKRKLDGQWHAFGGGRYSVNHWDLVPGKRSFNFKTNWDGGVAGDGGGSFYFMTAGGRDTRPSAANPSRHKIKRKDTKPKYEAIKLKSAKIHLAKRGKLMVTWETDSQTLPQFGFKITGHDDPSGQGEPLFLLESVEPHARRAELPMQKALGQAQIFVRIRCLDVLDNESPVLSLKLDD